MVVQTADAMVQPLGERCAAFHRPCTTLHGPLNGLAMAFNWLSNGLQLASHWPFNNLPIAFRRSSTNVLSASAPASAPASHRPLTPVPCRRRDLFPEGRRVYELQQQYELEMAEPAEVTARVNLPGNALH